MTMAAIEDSEYVCPTRHPADKVSPLYSNTTTDHWPADDDDDVPTEETDLLCAGVADSGHVTAAKTPAETEALLVDSRGPQQSHTANDVFV